ncbi:DNA polymerase III subunit [Roseimaritima sediminicola]|uniref:DNA polymerase III subunit n=1 Tax=Roseimaritima sediminicola TaxID=2662066 RepID=UPI001298464F|nr:AAA family ATPase [Roseimaritima sediminicola]
MNWDRLLGHQQQRQWFAAAIRQRRLGGAFLFVGPEGIGKRTFALLLAKTMLCERNAAADMNPCGVCEACAQVEAGSHPDVLQVGKPADKSTIPVELLIGPREARMQSGLCHDIYLRPFRGRRRVGILQDADLLSIEAGNCMLKTLEEPPSSAIIILIGTSAQRQLPTIRSRCQTIRFAPPTGEEAATLLGLHGAEDVSPEQAMQALELAGGDAVQAAALLQEGAGEFRKQLLAALDQPLIDAVALARSVSGYVEEGGKDAGPRRARMREVFGVAVQHFRRRLRAGAESNRFDARELYRLDRCLMALQEVDRNVNQATLIESWAVDLQRGEALPAS